VLYTSGSTGRPKGVMLTHRTVCNNASAIGSYLRNEPDDVVLCLLPLSFSYGLFQVLTAAEVGYAVALERSLAYPPDVLRRMSDLRVTGLPGVPSVFAILLQHLPADGVDLGPLRYVTNAGSALPAAHLARLRALLPGVRIYCMYGQTECTRASYLEPELLDEKPGSVGRAIPNSEVYLVDDDGKRLPPGSTGELVVRGANVMRGYWRRPEDTARRLRLTETGERVLHTGDLFHMDADGYLTFVARRDDVFKSKGEKVSPREIEAVLHELPEVVEVAVVGVPHPLDGLAIKAFVVLAPDSELDPRRIRRHCRARLESHLVPRLVELRGELPKTESGKVNKTALV
jgi:long-chain acyl-CoA synthetase